MFCHLLVVAVWLFQAEQVQVEVQPVQGFSLAGGIPNAVWDAAEQQVLLIYQNGDLLQVRASDGINFNGEDAPNEALNHLLDALELKPVDVIVRPTASGSLRYFMKGLGPPDVEERHIYAADYDGASFQLLNAGLPVYTGGPNDGPKIEVPDIIEDASGVWRMFYVALSAQPGNVRSAVSEDEGLSWHFDDDNPFGDVNAENQAAFINVDPAPLRLASGHFVAVTMRTGVLYFWNATDGRTFSPLEGVSLSVADFPDAPSDALALFDPTLVQLPDGTVMLYTTAGSGNALGAVVAARITFTFSRPGFDTDRWLPHITALDGAFETRIIFTNTGTATASVTALPLDVGGNSGTSVAVNVEAGHFQALDAVSFGPSVSHLAISGSEDILVTAAYRIRQPALGATAHVQETDQAGTSFLLYPAEPGLVFDGAAFVNVGTAPASVTASLVSGDGTVHATASLATDLDRFAKGLAIFSNFFEDTVGFQVRLSSDQPLAVLFLRGSWPDVEPAFLYQVIPILGGP